MEPNCLKPIALPHSSEGGTLRSISHTMLLWSSFGTSRGILFASIHRLKNSDFLRWRGIEEIIRPPPALTLQKSLVPFKLQGSVPSGTSNEFSNRINLLFYNRLVIHLSLLSSLRIVVTYTTYLSTIEVSVGDRRFRQKLAAWRY